MKGKFACDLCMHGQMVGSLGAANMRMFMASTEVGADVIFGASKCNSLKPSMIHTIFAEWN